MTCIDCDKSAEVRGRCRQHYKQHWARTSPKAKATREAWENRTGYRKTYLKAYYQQNADTIKARIRKYRQDNPRRVRETQAKSYRANPLPFKERASEWARANPDRARVAKHNNRAKRRGAPGRATPEQVQARIDYYGRKCYLCGGPYEHIDHVIPIARGGSNWPANLRPACAPCNLSKHARTLQEVLTTQATR